MRFGPTAVLPSGSVQRKTQESSVQQRGAGGFCYQASEFCF